MVLSLVGMGLSSVKDVSLKGLEVVRKADKVYFESYTGLLQCTIKDLEKEYKVKIIPADRTLVEQKAEQTILKDAKTKNTVFLVAGDPLTATTHIDLLQRAKKLKIKTEVVHSASIVTAVAVTGLQVYKFGRTASIPFVQGDYMPETPYNILKDNIKAGMHTLLLLDLRPDQDKFMKISDAINYLLKIELKRNEKVFTANTLCVGCARIGSETQEIRAGNAKDVSKLGFGKPPYCLIVPGKMHFVEEEFLQHHRIQ